MSGFLKKLALLYAEFPKESAAYESDFAALQAQLGETNDALAACQSEGGAWKHRAEMAELLLSDTGQRRIYWAALAVANAIRLGIGGMIRGTAAEQDLRDALWLREGEIRDVPKGATVTVKEVPHD
jgi:hypothetical protein